VASAFASQVLVYFDDPRAQMAVDQYLSKDAAKFAREQKANGIGPLGPWPPKKEHNRSSDLSHSCTH
jgi:hypothetical protein